jgi:hypothetical protein
MPQRAVEGPDLQVTGGSVEGAREKEERNGDARQKERGNYAERSGRRDKKSATAADSGQPQIIPRGPERDDFLPCRLRRTPAGYPGNAAQMSRYSPNAPTIGIRQPRCRQGPVSSKLILESRPYSTAAWSAAGCAFPDAFSRSTSARNCRISVCSCFNCSTCPRRLSFSVFSSRIACSIR